MKPATLALLLVASLVLVRPLTAQIDAAYQPASSLVLEHIPPVPMALVEKAAPYSESRSAIFEDWTPGDRSVLISTRFGATAQIHKVAQPMGARTQLTFFPDRVSRALYPPKDANWMLLVKDVGGAEFYQFYRFSPETGEVRLLTDGTSRNLDPVFRPDGHAVAFASTKRNGNDVDLWVLDPQNPGSERLLAQFAGGGLGVTDWSPDGNTIAVVDERSINDSTVYLVDAATGDKRAITPAAGQVGWSEPHFTKDGKGLLVLTDKDSDFHRLCRLSLEGNLGSCLSGKIPWDVEEFDLSHDGRLAAFLTNEDGIGKLHVVSLATGAELKEPELPYGVPANLRFREQGHELAFDLTTPAQPADVFTVDADSGKMERWTQSEIGGVSLKTAQAPKLIHWKAADGVTISGFLYPANARFTGKRPVMISIHGGPEGQSRPSFRGIFNYFTEEMGISVIEPNVRGSTGYGKKYTLLDNGMKRQDSVHDIGALLDWIAAQQDLDKDRVVVTGGSYGGFMTLSVATQYDARIRCTVEIVGISNLRTFLEHTSGYRRDLRRAEYGDERDPEMRAFMEKTAPANMTQNVTKPMFMIVGYNDPRVPYTESVQFKEKLEAQHTPVWFLMAKDEGHGYAKKPNRDFQFYATIAFLQANLLGSASEINEFSAPPCECEMNSRMAMLGGA
jgi:dipeptidyl aminopeptidase/acylaminoacyl peptidase